MLQWFHSLHTYLLKAVYFILFLTEVGDGSSQFLLNHLFLFFIFSVLLIECSNIIPFNFIRDTERPEPCKGIGPCFGSTCD